MTSRGRDLSGLRGCPRRRFEKVVYVYFGEEAAVLKFHVAVRALGKREMQARRCGLNVFM